MNNTWNLNLALVSYGIDKVHSSNLPQSVSVWRLTNRFLDFGLLDIAFTSFAIAASISSSSSESSPSSSLSLDASVGYNLSAYWYEVIRILQSYRLELIALNMLYTSLKMSMISLTARSSFFLAHITITPATLASMQNPPFLGDFSWITTYGLNETEK